MPQQNWESKADESHPKRTKLNVFCVDVGSVVFKWTKDSLSTGMGCAWLKSPLLHSRLGFSVTKCFSGLHTRCMHCALGLEAGYACLQEYLINRGKNYLVQYCLPAVEKFSKLSMRQAPLHLWICTSSATQREHDWNLVQCRPDVSSACF